MSNQKKDIDPASSLFEPDQNVNHDKLIESGALEQQAHKKAQTIEVARKKKEQKAERERKKQKRKDDIVALAKKHNQTVAGIKLRLSELSMEPVQALDKSLENEQRTEDLERELRIVEELYTELLIKVDELTEKDPNVRQTTVEEFSRVVGLSMDDAAAVLVDPASFGRFGIYEPLMDQVRKQRQMETEEG